MKSTHPAGWRRFLRLLPWRRGAHDAYLSSVLADAGVKHDAPQRTPLPHDGRSARTRRADQPLALTGSIGVLGLGGATASALKEQFLIAVVFVVILAICLIGVISGAVGRSSPRTDSSSTPHKTALTEQSHR